MCEFKSALDLAFVFVPLNNRTRHMLEKYSLLGKDLIGHGEIGAEKGLDKHSEHLGLFFLFLEAFCKTKSLKWSKQCPKHAWSLYETRRNFIAMSAMAVIRNPSRQI